jgi:hypothetical protein
MGRVLLKDWKVSTDDEWVNIKINDSIDLFDLEFTLIDAERKPLIKMKVTSREISLKYHSDQPIFAQLGDSVQYVDGSGDAYYALNK